MKKLELIGNFGDKVVPGNKYVVYYPYREGFHTTTAYRYFDFLNQSQKDLNSSSGIVNKCFYFSSDVFTFNGQNVSNLSLHADNSVLCLQLELPEGEYTKIELVNVDGMKPFYGYARSTITSDGFKVINSPILDKKNSLTLNLTNVNIEEDDEGEIQPCKFYMSVNPTKTGNFVIKATDSEGYVLYSDEVFGNMEFKAGHGYIIECNMSYQKPYNDDNTENAIRYVDLGTSVYWATLNVGALSPSELGDRYAWGELIAEGENLTEYSLEKRDDYTWENYKWYNNGKFEKYGYKCPSSHIDFPSMYKLPTLQREDDIATQLFGGKWRIPSVAEMEELRDECFWETTDNYMGSGVAGFIVYKAKCDEDKCKFYNHNGNNKVVPKENYNVNSDAHIFLPSVYNESQHYHWARYMSDQTAWDRYEIDRWNTSCITMTIYDILDKGSKPSCLNNVYVSRSTSLSGVYKPMLVRPVCDKQ